MEHQRLWVSVFTAIIGVAILAVIFSRQSATAGVLSAAGGALSGLLRVAVSPITGGSNVGPFSSGGGSGVGAALGSALGGATQTGGTNLPFNIAAQFPGAGGFTPPYLGQ